MKSHIFEHTAATPPRRLCFSVVLLCPSIHLGSWFSIISRDMLGLSQEKLIHFWCCSDNVCQNHCSSWSGTLTGACFIVMMSYCDNQSESSKNFDSPSKPQLTQRLGEVKHSLNVFFWWGTEIMLLSATRGLLAFVASTSKFQSSV